MKNQNAEDSKERGVLPTNRPPVSSQVAIIGSEDTVTLSLYVHWNNELFVALSKIFDELKSEAQNGDHDRDYLPLKGKIYKAAPTGHKSGMGSGPMYRWRFDCDGIKISIANQSVPKNGIPNVIVNIGSLYLMKNGGLLGAWSSVSDMIKALECNIEMIKLSRLDGCVDLADIDVSDYVSRYEKNWYISRATKGGVFNVGRRKTGFKLGTGKQIRVYDKRFEVMRQPEKLLILMQTRWGGRLPESATRVEFQVGSEGLRDLGISTLEDYEKQRFSLFQYLTHDWFRMTDAEPKDNHHNRISTSAVWEIVQRAFHTWTQQDAPCPLAFRSETRPDYSRLSKQAVGCVNSIIALKDIQFEDSETLKHYLKTEFDKMLLKEDLNAILKKTEHKRLRFNSLGRIIE